MKIKKTLHKTPNSNYIEMVLSMVQDLDEGIYDIIIMDKDHMRTHDQNSLLWGVVYKAIAETTGYDIADVHDICRAIFLKDENGDLISTAGLSKKEFTDYLDKVIQWSATLGIKNEEI